MEKETEKILTEILVKLHTRLIPMNANKDFNEGFYEGARQARHILKEYLLVPPK